MALSVLTKRNGQEAASEAVPPAGGPAPHETAATSPRLRRRPLLLVVGVALLVMGAMAGVWLWSAASTSVEVVVVRADVQRGAIIPASALGRVRVTVDPSVQTVPGDQMESMVGRSAAVDLSAGALLTPSQVTDLVQPGEGMSMVGIPVAPGLMPAEPLRAGDQVRLVQTPGPSGEVSDKNPSPAVITATVVRVTPGETQTVVDVLVTQDKSAELAARAATGKVAVVLDSRER